VNIQLAGLPLFAWSGMIAFGLLTVQVLGGLKIIKMPLKWHRYLAYILVAWGLAHGLVAILSILS